MDCYPCIWVIFAAVCLVAGDAARPHDHPLGTLIRRARDMDSELHKQVTRPRPVRSVFDYNWNKATDTATSTTPSTTPPETPPPTVIPTTAAPPTTEATTTTTEATTTPTTTAAPPTTKATPTTTEATTTPTTTAAPPTTTTTPTTKAIPVNPNDFCRWDLKKMEWIRKYQMASKKLQQQLAKMAKKQRKLFGRLKIPGLKHTPRSGFPF